MKQLPHNLGKLMAIAAIAVIVVGVLVVAMQVAPASAAPAAQSGAAVASLAASQAPTATKVSPPEAVLTIVAIPANAKTTNPITATISYMTDTAAGSQKAVVALGSTGLTNEPLGVPLRFAVSPADATSPVTQTTWTVTGPADSKDKLAKKSTKIAAVAASEAAIAQV